MLRARKSVMMCETAPGTAPGPLIVPTCIRTYDLMPIRTRPYRNKDTSLSASRHVAILTSRRVWTKKQGELQCAELPLAFRVK